MGGVWLFKNFTRYKSVIIIIICIRSTICRITLYLLPIIFSTFANIKATKEGREPYYPVCTNSFFELDLAYHGHWSWSRFRVSWQQRPQSWWCKRCSLRWEKIWRPHSLNDGDIDGNGDDDILEDPHMMFGPFDLQKVYISRVKSIPG